MDELTQIKAKCFDLAEMNAKMNLEVTNFIIKLGKVINVDLTPSGTLEGVLTLVEDKFKKD